MRFQRIWLVAGASLLVAACEIPTDPPILEQRWILPLDVVTLDQEELLPAAVTLAGNLYDVAVDPASASSTLGSLCAACAPLNGLPVPAPAFTGSFQSDDALPTDVVSADVASGSVDVTITNGLPYDPIEGGGSLTITVAGGSGGPVLGTLTLSSANGDAFPPGMATPTPTLTLGSGTVVGSIVTTVAVVSPGGQPITMDVTDQVSISAVTNSLFVSSATVAVDGNAASLSGSSLDVDDLDEGVIDAVESGSVVLDVTNPFGVSFMGSVTLASVTKNVAVNASPTSVVEIAFTGQELRDILGTIGATFSGSGTLGGGPAVVTPGAELAIDPTIDLVLQLGR